MVYVYIYVHVYVMHIAAKLFPFLTFFLLQLFDCLRYTDNTAHILQSWRISAMCSFGDLISVCDSVPVRDSWSGSEDRHRDRNQGDFGNEGDFLVKEFQHCLWGPCRKAVNNMTIVLFVVRLTEWCIIAVKEEK